MNNPLLQISDLPAFDAIRPEHVGPAVDALLAEANTALEAAVSPAVPADYEAVASRLNYFSFITLTSLGYGDITPVSPVARSLTVLEALVGVLYPAALLGWLVSLVARQSAPLK